MTGPEHYREAERLIAQANRITEGNPGPRAVQAIAEAQVHATLAVASGLGVDAEPEDADGGQP